MALLDMAGALATGHRLLDTRREGVIALADEVERRLGGELREEVAAAIDTMRNGMAAYFAYKDSLLALLPLAWYSGLVAAQSASHRMMLAAMDQLAQAVRDNTPPVIVAAEFGRLATRMLGEFAFHDGDLVGALVREGHLHAADGPIPPPLT